MTTPSPNSTGTGSQPSRKPPHKIKPELWERLPKLARRVLRLRDSRRISLDVTPPGLPNDPTHGIPKPLWRDLPEDAQCALHLEAGIEAARDQESEAWEKGRKAWKPSHPARLAADPARDPKRYGERAYALALGFAESKLVGPGQPYPWAKVSAFVTAKRASLERLEREEAARIAALPPLRRIWINIVDDGTPPDWALEARADERASNLDRATQRATSRRDQRATEAGQTENPWVLMTRFPRR